MRLQKLAALAVGVGLFTAAVPVRAEPSRWIAALPFGAGQFQNGDVGRGLFFAVGEILFGGSSLGSAAYIAAIASSAPTPSRLASTNAKLATAAAINRVTFAGWGALTLAGILEAEVSFAPNRAAVTATPTPGGASLGFRLGF